MFHFLYLPWFPSSENLPFRPPPSFPPWQCSPGFSGLAGPQRDRSRPLGPSLILPVSEEAPLTLHCYYYYYPHYCDRRHPGPTLPPSPTSQSPIVHSFHSDSPAPAASTWPSHTTHHIRAHQVTQAPSLTPQHPQPSHGPPASHPHNTHP